MKKITSLLWYPFTNEFRFFLFIFLFSAIVEMIGFALFESIPKACYIALHHYIICYILCFLIQFFPKSAQVLYKRIILCLLLVNYIIDLVCVYSFHFTFDREVPAILIGTNTNEAKEFLHTFLPYDFWLLFISTLVILGFIYKLIPTTIHNQYKHALLTVVCFGIGATIFLHSKNWGNVSLTKIITFTQVSSPPDLKPFQVAPHLYCTDSIKPRYVVMIIGESFAKSHSSLYGYELRTNPHLESLRDSNYLYVYTKVQSPALNTIPVFKSLMSTYKPNHENSNKWYEHLALPTILHSAGYNTLWVSNQSEKGFHDNIVAKYAFLCNKTIFAGNRFAAMSKADLDEILIDIVERELHICNDDSLQFHFIHLMGSHPDFKKRYPAQFKKFDSKDYPQKEANQKEVIAAYDNSIIYNDSVVYKLMSLYSQKEAVIFYFSDHGLDVFDSRKDYAGHATYNILKSAAAGYNIPFVIYTSRSFKSHFSHYIKCIENTTDKLFCIDNMIYTIMDLIGEKFTGNNKVKQHSLFSNE